MRRPLYLLVLAVIMLGATPSQNASGRFADFDAFIARTLKDFQVPGAAIAVVENGKVVFIKGYGVRNITKPGRVDANTIFQLASVSKTFTAAAAGSVVDEGKLQWDKPIVNYLPQFQYDDPYVTRYMTMRDLLAMRTGWPQFTGDMLDTFGYTRPEILHRLRYLKPAYSFREVAQYSNAGYFVAGEVAGAAAGGMSWNDLVKRRILDPLGMKRSGTSFRDVSDPNSYTPHAQVGGKIVPIPPNNQDTMGAAGSVTSTAADMARYLQMYLADGQFGGASILKSDTIAEMYKRSMVAPVEFTEAPPISNSTGFYYGMGFDSYDYAGYHVIEKAGGFSGVRTIVTMVPERHAGIVILSNLNIATFPEAVRAYYIEKMLLGRSAEADVQAIQKMNAKILALFDPPKRPAAPAPFAGKLSGLSGTYENQLYGRCTIAQKGASMTFACGPAKYSAPLVHWNGGQFLAKWPGATTGPDEITFTIGADGSATSFHDDPLGVFTRVKE